MGRQAAAANGVESKPYDSQKEYNGYTFYLHANTYNHVDGAHNAAAAAVAVPACGRRRRVLLQSPRRAAPDRRGRLGGRRHLPERRRRLRSVHRHQGCHPRNGRLLGQRGDAQLLLPRCARLCQLGTLVRNGSGLCMGMWAGAQMVPINHSKMVHGGGALTRVQVPFLNLNIHGERFMNEALSFAYLNNLVRDYLAEYNYENSMAAKFFTVMPANWLETRRGMGRAVPQRGTARASATCRCPTRASSSPARRLRSLPRTSTPTWLSRSGSIEPD